jgi:hypothetical protein
MKNLILTYAFLKALYDKNNDYLDSFCPFVLNALYIKNKVLTVPQIQDFIKKYYKISIPLHTLGSILTRAKRKHYVIDENKENILTDSGREYFDSLETERDVGRRINELVKDLKEFLKNKSLKDKEILDLLLQFVNKNIEPLLCLCSSDMNLNTSFSNITEYGDQIIKYFHSIEKSRPQIWETLKNIIYGSLISLAPSTIDITEEKRKFNKLNIFIDSNFLFSVFNLDPIEISKPIIELFNLIKDSKFNIKIFDITVDEAIGVLKGYIYSQNKYIEGVKVDSIYSVLKNKKWTSQDVYIFIQNIYKKIKDYGIEIINTSMSLNNYLPEEEYINDLKKYKYVTEYNYFHDLAVIEMIKKIRGERKWKIENAVAIFLSSDLKLSRFNYEIMHHKEKQTICEVIPDRLFTNILWLKDPYKLRNLPLSMVIAVNSKAIFIDKKIWGRFMFNLENLKSDGEINDLDIAMLFYNNHIQDVLMEFDELEIDKINKDFILEESLKIKKKIDKETREKISLEKKISEEEKKKSEEEIKKKDIEIKKYINKFMEIKDCIEASVLKKSNFFSILIHGIIIVVIIVAIVLTSYFLKEYLIYIALILAIAQIFGVSYDVLKMRSKLRDKIFNKLFSKRIDEINLKNLNIEEEI